MSVMKITDMNFPSVWDDEDTVMMNDEDFSEASYEEVGKVLEQWQTFVDDLDIMEVDEQIGSNLLHDEYIYDPCVSPTGPLEELGMLKFDEDDLDRFSLAFLDDANELSHHCSTVETAPFNDQYKETLSKLAESMKRSQETRKCLQMKTPKTQDYQRQKSVTGVLTSIEMSSQQLQGYLKNIKQTV